MEGILLQCCGHESNKSRGRCRAGWGNTCVYACKAVLLGGGEFPLRGINCANYIYYSPEWRRNHQVNL